MWFSRRRSDRLEDLCNRQLQDILEMQVDRTFLSFDIFPDDAFHEYAVATVRLSFKMLGQFRCQFPI